MNVGTRTLGSWLHREFKKSELAIGLFTDHLEGAACVGAYRHVVTVTSVEHFRIFGVWQCHDWVTTSPGSARKLPQRALGLAAAHRNNLCGSIELIGLAGVARDLDQQVRVMCGQLQS